MRSAVVAVGDELLLGDIVNGNAAWLGERLAAVGAPVVHSSMVGDDVERIATAVRRGLEDADVVLARELGVTLLRFFVIRHGVMPASRGGKLKTILQAVAIVFYVLPLSGLLHGLGVAVMAAAVVVTLVTGVDYVLQAVRLRRTSDRAAQKRERREVRG